MIVFFMDVYVKFFIQICYKCGVYVMGGMVVQIFIKDDFKVNEVVMEGVRVDKFCEVKVGYDGIWVVYFVLVGIVVDIFNKYMFIFNQLFVRWEDVMIGQNDLLNMNVFGQIIEVGIRKNLNIGLGYMEVWIRGVGCVFINYLM